jgi:hypothetical protein
MPVSDLHGVEHGVDERPGDLFVKEVTHGVDEDSPGLPPMKWLCEAFWPEGEVKPIREGVSANAAKSFGKALRVAEIAAVCDL